jgi:hypothetical protein
LPAVFSPQSVGGWGIERGKGIRREGDWERLQRRREERKKVEMCDRGKRGGGGRGRGR